MVKRIKSIHMGGNWFSDIILGGQDGLVNVLGIILGVTAANGSHQILLAASMASGLAEAVSMAAVEYTSQLASKAHYEKEKQREYSEVENTPEDEREEIRQIYIKRGFEGTILEEIVKIITADKDKWVANMMVDELGLEPIEADIVKSSLWVGLSAIVGSVIPVLPFFFIFGNQAVLTSLVVGGTILFIAGVYKAKTMVGNWWKSGLQMLSIGMGAAFVGFVIGKIFGAV
jgi:predicted membrane protein (TIGR00267 family)